MFNYMGCNEEIVAQGVKQYMRIKVDTDWLAGLAK
jgi:hypothetical protein